MAENARDELIGHGGEAAGVVFVVEGVFAVLEEGHIDVHAVARHAEQGLGHEGGVEPVLLRQRLDRQLEGHDVVGGGEGVGVLEVDLVLPRGALVVGRLDLKAHVLQRQTDLLAGEVGGVQRPQVEVAHLVVGGGGGPALGVGLEEEELALRAHVEGVAHVRGLLQHPVENPPGIAGKGRPVRVVDIAEHPRADAELLIPGQHHEAVQIGVQVLVGFLDAGVALNGAAVEHDLVVHGLFYLGGGQRDVFELPENIGKLHTDKVYILFARHADHIFTGILSHIESPPLAILSIVYRITCASATKIYARLKSPRVNLKIS